MKGLFNDLKELKIPNIWPLHCQEAMSGKYPDWVLERHYNRTQGHCCAQCNRPKGCTVKGKFIKQGESQ